MRQSIILSSDSEKEVSVFKDGNVSAETWAEGSKMLSQAFPRLPIEWFKILREFVKGENFSDEKFMYAVRNLIKTCIYPEPTIASILNFDVRVRIYEWNEIIEATKSYSAEQRGNYFNQFVAVNNAGRVGYVLRINFNEQIFTKWEKK